MNKKDFLLKIDAMIAMTYKGNHGNYDIGMQQKWYDVDAVQWYTCNYEEAFYICIQGSRSSQDNNQDWKENKKFKQVKFKYDEEIKIHKGHYKQAETLFRKMKKTIEEWYNYHIYDAPRNIVICGHSLGGALAQILPMFLLYNTFVNLEDVAVVTEGAPRSYNKAGRDCFNDNVGYSIRLVNADDPVTRVPFKWMLFWRYWHVANKIQIGKKAGWRRLLPWNYKKWIKQDADHNPLSYRENIKKLFKE